ncbi:hypothetical protein VNO80_19797 [Phaseolus coccineus]|uniref:Uncharacterized protein n=1 Tax=Phaseolus coccineus TaxID=3886 RepID=A0AAN9MLW7_PHACN
MTIKSSLPTVGLVKIPQEKKNIKKKTPFSLISVSPSVETDTLALFLCLFCVHCKSVLDYHSLSLSALFVAVVIQGVVWFHL